MASSPTASLSSARIPAGTQLNGIYEIDHLIASGGMGEVYKGHAIETGDPVAIKLMLADLASNDAALALFRKEASALHYLYHEAIVRYYVFTVEPTLQCPYLAMEFVEGESLSDLLQRGPLPFDEAVTLMRRIAGALEAAHQRQIIHRDVSPDNIIIPGGQVSRAKIIDFGIARSTQAGAQTVIGGGFAGKYNYVSPEQLGLFGGDVTGKSDIYSLGLVAVEALTGRPIDMSGSQVDVIEKRRKVPDLSAVDPRIRPLVTQMLQPNPDDRPASMAAVEAWSATPAAPAAREPPAYSLREGRMRSSEPARRGSSTRSLLAIAAGVAIVLLGGGGAAYYFLNTGPTVVAPPPPLQPGGVTQPPPGPEPGKTATAPDVFVPTPKEAPIEAPKSERVAGIEKFIEQYDGGDCFFITTVAATEQSARIEGYGASLAPFQILDDAFRRTNGFEADIGLWQVTAPQCPAVNFLNKVRGGRRGLPRFQAVASEVRGGQEVSGTVTDYVGRPLALLIVDDAGRVRNVSRAMSPRKGGKACVGACPMVEQEDVSFTLRMDPVATGPRPRLLVAVASAEPLALSLDLDEDADKVFEQLQTQAASRGQTLGAAAKYVNVSK
jgi:serine/threonine-protein kinase